MKLHRLFGRGNTRAVVLSAALMAMVAAPFALAAGEGKKVRGGARNPSDLQTREYTRETQIIANNGSYGTRQSNKSANGGGAIYGCRSGEGGTPAGNEPCLRATNLARGLAFEFASDGVLGGTIEVGNGGDEEKPFTTNATGVATGLNADRVDGVEGSELVAKADVLYARVAADGTLGTNRGATEATFVPATDTSTITFNRDVDTCAYTVTANTATADAGTVFAAAPVPANKRQITVDQTDADPAVPFYVQVTC